MVERASYLIELFGVVQSDGNPHKACRIISCKVDLSNVESFEHFS